MNFSIETLIFFLIAAIAALIVPLFQGRHQDSPRHNNLRQLGSISVHSSDWKRLIGLLLLAGAFYISLLAGGRGGYFHASFLYCLLGITITWLLNRFPLSSGLGSTLLLGVSLLISLFMGFSVKDPATPPGMPLIAYFGGILLGAIPEAFLKPEKPVWETLLPTLAWIGGIYWITTAMPMERQGSSENLLLAALAITLLLRLAQTLPFHLGDRFFIRPLLLAIIGGLSLAGFIQTFMLAPSFMPWALLYAGGILLAAIVKSPPTPSEEPLLYPKLFSALLLVGLGALAASRLFGVLGWIVLAVPAIIFPTPRFAVYAGFFWVTRVLLQGYIYQYNPNVTGINVTHPYAGAALYGGITLGLMLPLLLQSLQSKTAQAIGFIAAGIVLPMAANYFFQSETVSSLLLAVTIAGVLMTFLQPAILKPQHTSTIENWLPFPLLMITSAILSNDLITLGTQAVRQQKLIVLSILFVIVFLGMIVIQRWALPHKPALVSED